MFTHKGTGAHRFPLLPDGAGVLKSYLIDLMYRLICLLKL